MGTASDIDDSPVVEVLTWTMYLAWLGLIAGVAVYFQIEPLRSIQEAFEGPWQGTAAAVATGVLILMGAQRASGGLRARLANKSTEGEDETPVDDDATEPEPEPAKKKRKKKEKKKSFR